MNAGLRFDYFKQKTKVWGSKDSKSEHQWSPRFGIAFAVSDKTGMYGNYGWFSQLIQLVGNPDKTVSYEIGLKHAFTPDVRGDITAYYKDVPVLLSSEQVDTHLESVGMPVQYTRMETNDFATVKGVDMSLSRRRGIFTGRLTYSYMSATGTGSNGREFYYYYMVEGEPRPRREYPLEFDVTHTVKTSVNMYLKQGYGPAFLGVKPFSDLNANLQFTFMSGAPYTPVDDKGKPMEMGSKRMPFTHQTDLKIVKAFRGAGGLKYGLFLDVRNLFDVENVVNIYPATGKPDDDTYMPTRESYSTDEEWKKAVEVWERYAKDPNNYGIPRIIRIGLWVRI